MASVTTNLSLALKTLGDTIFKRNFRANMESLDTTIGDIAGVATIAGDSIAEKLTALEARVAALEP